MKGKGRGTWIFFFIVPPPSLQTKKKERKEKRYSYLHVRMKTWTIEKKLRMHQSVDEYFAKRQQKEKKNSCHELQTVVRKGTSHRRCEIYVDNLGRVFLYYFKF